MSNMRGTASSPLGVQVPAIGTLDFSGRFPMPAAEDSQAKKRRLIEGEETTSVNADNVGVASL